MKPLLARLSFLVSQPFIILAAIGAGLAIVSAPALLGDEGHRRSAVATDIASSVDVLAALVAHEAGRIGVDALRTSSGVQALVDALPSGVFNERRWLVIADEHDLVVTVEPRGERVPRRFSDLVSGAKPSELTAGRPWMAETTLPNGRRALATIRDIPTGHLAVLQFLPSQPRLSVLPPVEQAAPILAIVFALSILGIGCLCQARRARTAHLACNRLRTRLETSLSRGRCGLWDWDIARKQVFWSSSMYELLGYEPRTEPMSLAEVSAIVQWPGGDLAGFAAGLAASGADHLDQEFRARTAGGEWLWMRARAEIVLDPEDGSRHLVGIAVDITDERGRAERSAMADMRLRDAVDAISEAFVLWDSDNRLVLCNSKFQDLHDLPPGLAVPGASYRDVIEAVRTSVVENRPAAGYPQEPNARTFDKQLADGRWIHINERKTRDGGFVSVGTDITPLKQKEEKLLASERRLTASVGALKQSRKVLQIQAQRLAELAERNHEERARAELASRAKTEFLAKMSHELRTPLNAILGFADMMRQGVLGPLGCARYYEYSNDIHESGEKLLSVIDHILKMSKIESGRVELALAPVALANVAEQAFAAVSREAAAKDLKLATDLDTSAVLSADPIALREVLVQLLRNSVTFTRRGGTVRLRARSAGDAFNIFVEDDGVGIPQEFLGRLCRPFEQVEAEYSRRDGGAGLGLAIARALTELHHGSLRIRSIEGQGTVALVHLPNVPPAANDVHAIEGRPRRLELVAAE